MPHASATARMNQMRALMGGAFLPSFLGLAATRVWLQVNLFASYTQSDDGLFTVVNNLAYGLVMVIGAAIALRKPFSKGNRTAVAWLGFACAPASAAHWAAACGRRRTCGWDCASRCCTGSCRWPSDRSAAWRSASCPRRSATR